MRQSFCLPIIFKDIIWGCLTLGIVLQSHSTSQASELERNKLTSFEYRNIEYDIVLFCGSFLLLLCGPGQALLGSEWIQARPGWEETQTGTGEGLKLSSTE